MKPGTLLIRADANVSIGTGHVMRCLALAEAWQDTGGSTVFAAAEIPAALESRLTSNGVSLLRIEATPGGAADAAATVACASQARADWIVVDGDRFDSDFLEKLGRTGLRVLRIDDFAGREAFPADLIVNPNLGADSAVYRAKGSGAQVLSGPRYILLRREFHKPHERQFPKQGNRVLVTLGGSDPENLTPRIVSALAGCSDLELTVVAGAGYVNVSDLQELSAPNLRIVVDSQNMASLMMEADIAVIAAGGTLWELISVGCAVLSYSRNAVQMRVVQMLASDGVVVDMGDTAQFDPQKIVTAVGNLGESCSAREEMAGRGRMLVDGLGAARVVEAMQQYGGR
jgi:UDP-2,4-diacetamido-2,4,6-trideoxy-beta-L-altropyranose hydrolase